MIPYKHEGAYMEETHVVTCFLERDSDKKIALLRRSQMVGTYRGRWVGISGYIERENTPLKQAFEEIREEAGLNEDDIRLMKEGEPLNIIDEKLGKRWVVHPFRFRLTRPEKIEIDWEHTELKWIEPKEIKMYETVPRLYDAWDRVR
jgi:8-oxo-dGTP pyrophosphatase MutT (NUDIX family)